MRDTLLVLLKVCPALVTDKAIEYGSYSVSKIPDILNLLRDADSRDYKDRDVCQVCLSGGESNTRHKVCNCTQYYHVRCVVDLIADQRKHRREEKCQTCNSPFNANEIRDSDSRVYFPRLGIYP